MKSPIDEFYTTRTSILKCATPDLLKNADFLAPLMLVGLVSAVEHYIRTLFSRLITICPLSKKHSAEKSINLGAVLWHGACDAERGAFEHLSFSDAEPIRKACRDFLGYEIKKSNQIESALKEYAKVCHLRHGIVHSSCFLPGRNAIFLNMPPNTNPQSISFGFGEVQESAAICNGLVVSLNTELFFELCRRWAVEWPRLPNWSPQNKISSFSQIWDTFFSEIDYKAGNISCTLSKIKCKNEVIKEFSGSYS
jgi:hypothetical protein